ncbi:unnamed protein product [Rotaria sordida]|uniref:NAD(P)(+)--arginine ADP-ribosyltransferase n=1 Tax=Rotaria sordida TaxID=392033 RepID=A0A815SLE2_9BILA|nr:unnamed protein product [Rotaria sordida]CAF1489624.1 unnamed protein product [Rotaria sordida]
MTSGQLQQERNFEENTLIWLDKDLYNSYEINQVKLKLRQIINYTKMFKNTDECVDYMSSNENEQVYLLISGSLADIVVPLIYQIEQIKMIYVVCINIQYHGKLSQTFDKIGGIFTNLNMLYDALRRDIVTNRTTTTHSISNSSALLLSALPSPPSDRSDQQEAAFMYFRMLTEVLVELEHEESTKNEFVAVCHSQYHGNTPELEKIEEFSQKYSKEQAVCWYTRDSFLYRILNNALRIQDIDILFKLGFFITDLYNQLKSLHSEQSKSLLLPSVVYRGQFMTKDEFDDKIRKNIGGFLSVNSFFSTSANKQVALMFTGNSSSNRLNVESVLFEISIEIEKCRQPIADIRYMSYMKEEDEILFSMAAVFRIKSVQRLHSEDFWTVRLVMNGEEDKELNKLANSIKNEIGHSNTLNTFGGLLIKMGDFQNAEYYMLMLIKNSQFNDSTTKATYYSNLSWIYNEQMNFDKALLWGEKALQLRPSNRETLAGVYNNLGLSHLNKGNVLQALNYLHKTVDVYHEFLPSDHPKLVIPYMNLGALYEKQENHLSALEYFLKTVNIVQNTLPTNHPTVALAYCHVGASYMYQNNLNSALFYLRECLRMQQRSLPPKHPILVHTYANLGGVYLKQHNDVEAYDSFQKALEIIGSSLNHPVNLLCNLLDGHQWEQIIRNYLPKLKVLRLSMRNVLSLNENIEEQVDELINSFRSSFWIDERKCLSKGCYYNYEKPSDLWRSTYPHDNQQNYYNDLTIIYDYTFFDQSFPTNIYLSKIKFLVIKFPMNNQFWSIVPNLKELSVLIISSYRDIFQTEFQRLLNRAPHLDHLRIDQEKSLPLQKSLFNYTSTSIPQLSLENYYFNEEECIALTHSSLIIQCQVLSIQVISRQSIIILVKNIKNLRRLDIQCEDDLHDGKTPNKHDLVQWLNDHLSSMYLIFRDSDDTSRIRIWI